ncbi:response regulator [Desulfococcaceae bacterium HSG8]|nr:response regulator [Desulfococcaceae bacterium HSG8]
MDNNCQTTILVIDDEAIIRQTYADYLEDMDYRILTAENGRIGLQILEREKVDLVLTDLRMPEVDGLEVLRRAGELSPETPLIVVSGTGVIGDAVDALHKGAWNYLLKPIEDFSVLMHAVTNALEKARLKLENRKYQQQLEYMVADRTEELKQANDHLRIELNERKRVEEELRLRTDELSEANEELIHHKDHLEDLVNERTKELKESLESLKRTQDYLIQSEKMAALGGLVAGVAHEINTPVGIGVTAASHLEDKTRKFTKVYKTGNLSRRDFESYINVAMESSKMILSNMNRAADLIQSFKQVAVDQSSEELRRFRIKKYVYEILASLHPKFKKTRYEIKVKCPDDFAINSFPGAFSQILTNLLINSLKHGFEGVDEGTISIEILKKAENVKMSYQDSGRGISEENISKIFDPFFTTKRGQGGSGLGMHIVYNLITQTLGGTIHCSSVVGEGTQFELGFPCDYEALNSSES